MRDPYAGLFLMEKLPSSVRWYGVFSRKQARKRVAAINKRIKSLWKRWEKVPATHKQLPSHLFREGYAVRAGLYKSITDLEKRRRLIKKRWRV
jgi:hypothetical protein